MLESVTDSSKLLPGLDTAGTSNEVRPPGSSTQAVHGRPVGRRSRAHHAIITPVVQTATSTFENTADFGGVHGGQTMGQRSGHG